MYFEHSIALFSPVLGETRLKKKNDCMKKFLLILLVMCVGFQGALLAQTKTVTGQVTGGDDRACGDAGNTSRRTGQSGPETEYPTRRPSAAFQCSGGTE